MNRTQLLDTLRSIRVPCEITFVHEATPSMKKTGNPYLNIVKRSVVTGQINFNYEGKWNDEMPEGFKTFKAGPRVWGKRVPFCPLVEHNGVFYLEVLPTEALPARYFLYEQEILASYVEKFLKTKPENQEGLVRPKDYKIEGITKINFGSEVLCITDT